MEPWPVLFLSVGTLGIILFGLTMLPVFEDRGAVTLRVRMAALVTFALGMVAFGISFALFGG